MPVNPEAYKELLDSLTEKKVQLVAVSKTKPVEDILALYQLGQRDFGENYVQELIEKQKQLPADIRWHFIGHLQTNKVKQIAAIVYLVHGVDSERLLREIDKQASKLNKKLDVLLQVHIAKEETKFGLSEDELATIIEHYKMGVYQSVKIRGLMGMASFTEDVEQVKKEFQMLRSLFHLYSDMESIDTLSMGMSGDYKLAIEEGSTMVRIGSLLFGAR
jgi:pyridoxal phosphate enzyme (YggS family)